MGYEVLSAFFLEAGFLGVMLFGMTRVGRGLHFFATLMVALGTLLSAFWILSANSWMQTPAGYAHQRRRPVHPARLVGGHLQSRRFPTASCTWCSPPTSPPRSWSAPSAPSTSCATARNAGARVMFSMAMWMAALVAPMQIVAGDLHGLNTLEHQPAKIAAMEGHWETRPRPAADPVRLARHAGARPRACRSRCRSSAACILTPRLERRR